MNRIKSKNATLVVQTHTERYKFDNAEVREKGDFIKVRSGNYTTFIPRTEIKYIIFNDNKEEK